MFCFPHLSLAVFFKKYFVYLFLESGEGREEERKRNISVWLPPTPHNWAPGLQPRHVPWLGIEPATLWFTGQHSVHWATPARAAVLFRIALQDTYQSQTLSVFGTSYYLFLHQHLMLCKLNVLPARWHFEEVCSSDFHESGLQHWGGSHWEICGCWQGRAHHDSTAAGQCYLGPRAPLGIAR